jgi:hypothetical protein
MFSFTGWMRSLTLEMTMPRSTSMTAGSLRMCLSTMASTDEMSSAMKYMHRFSFPDTTRPFKK